jgi:hypothetical protein
MKTEFKKGDILFHDTGYDNTYIFVYSHHEGTLIKGTYFTNKKSNFSGDAYANTTVKELRLATQEEIELLKNAHPNKIVTTMENRVIEVLNKNHGAKVVAYWKSLGFNISGFPGECTREGNDTCRYYGVIKGSFSNYSLAEVNNKGASIIELPEQELPERYVVECETKEEGQEVASYIKETTFSVGSVYYKYVVQHRGLLNQDHKDNNVWSSFIPNAVLHLPVLKFEDWKILVTGENTPQKIKKMEHHISFSEAQSIIDIACREWKAKLAEKWAVQIVQKNDVTISDGFYKTMRNACTTDQHKLFNKIFGEEEKKFKVGDWIRILSYGTSVGGTTAKVGDILEVKRFDSNGGNATPRDPRFYGDGFGLRGEDLILATKEEIEKAQWYPDGTPCLVKEYGVSWTLRYANGKGEFYNDGKKSGGTTSWKDHLKLDVNNLPPVS